MRRISNFSFSFGLLVGFFLSICVFGVLLVEGFSCAPSSSGCRYRDGWDCEPCSRGAVCYGDLNTFRKWCPRGRYMDREGSCDKECDVCGRNRATNKDSRATACDECPAGTDTRGKDKQYNVQDSCIPCGAGNVSSPGKDCHPCPPGHYSTSAKSGSCLQCPKGSWQDKQGQATCNVCEPGRSTKTSGSTTANDCFIADFGFFAARTQRPFEQAIFPCPDGRSTSTKGRSAPSPGQGNQACDIVCRGEEFVNNQYFNGEYSSAATKHRCVRCPTRYKYAPNSGSGSCQFYTNRNRKRLTPSFSLTRTVTVTPISNTVTFTHSSTGTQTVSMTQTFTVTRSISPTISPPPTPTQTHHASLTETPTETLLPTPSDSEVASDSSSSTKTRIPTPSASHVPSDSNTVLPSVSHSDGSPTVILSDSLTHNLTHSQTRFLTISPTDSPATASEPVVSVSRTASIQLFPVERKADVVAQGPRAANNILASIGGAPQHAMAASKIVAIQRLQSCSATDGKGNPQPPTPLGPDMNFMMLEIPAPDDEDNIFATQRGAIVGNTVITVGFAVLAFLIALLRARTSKISLYKAFIKTRFPGFIAVISQVCIPGIAASLAILLSWSRVSSAVDLVIVIVGVIMFLFNLIWFAWIVHYGRQNALRSYSLEDEDEVRQREEFERNQSVVDLQDLVERGAEENSENIAKLQELLDAVEKGQELSELDLSAFNNNKSKKKEDEEKEKEKKEEEEKEGEQQQQQQQQQPVGGEVSQAEWLQSVFKKVGDAAPVKFASDSVRFVTDMGLRASRYAFVRFWVYFAAATIEYPKCIFTKSMGPAFESFSIIWFLIVEYLACCFTNIAFGISTRCVTKTCCYLSVTLALLCCVAHFGVLCLYSLRVHTSRMERIVGPLMSGVTFLLVIAILANTIDNSIVDIRIVSVLTSIGFYLSYIGLAVSLSWNFLPAALSFKRYLERFWSRREAEKKNRQRQAALLEGGLGGEVGVEIPHSSSENQLALLGVDYNNNDDQELLTRPQFSPTSADDSSSYASPSQILYGQQQQQREEEEGQEKPEQEEDEGEAMSMGELQALEDQETNEWKQREESRQKQARVKEYDHLDSNTVQSLYDQYSAQLRQIDLTNAENDANSKKNKKKEKCGNELQQEREGKGEEAEEEEDLVNVMRKNLKRKVDRLFEVLEDQDLVLFHHKAPRSRIRKPAATSAAASGNSPTTNHNPSTTSAASSTSPSFGARHSLASSNRKRGPPTVEENSRLLSSLVPRLRQIEASLPQTTRQKIPPRKRLLLGTAGATSLSSSSSLPSSFSPTSLSRLMEGQNSNSNNNKGDNNNSDEEEDDDDDDDDETDQVRNNLQELYQKTLATTTKLEADLKKQGVDVKLI